MGTLLSVGCSKEDNTFDNPRKTIALTKSQDELTSSGNMFALNLLSTVNQSANSSYVFSPISLEFNLGMVLNAITGESNEEICTTLGFPKDGLNDANEYFKLMRTKLPNLDKQVSLGFSNWSFLNTAFQEESNYFKPFIDNITNVFGSKTNSFQFDEKGISDIYTFAKEHGIENHLNNINPETIAILINETSFKGEWNKAFLYSGL